MRYFRGIVVVLLLVFCVTGCGVAEENASADFVITKEGTIYRTISDTFDQSYYDVEELKAMIANEVSDYNNQNGADHIIVEDCSMDNQIVSVKMRYNNMQDYNAFNERTCFYGTVQNAIDNQYSFSVSLHSASNAEEILSAENMADMAGKHLLILDEAGTIEVPGKILYISDGVELTGKRTAVIADDMEGYCYVIYK